MILNVTINGVTYAPQQTLPAVQVPLHHLLANTRTRLAWTLQEASTAAGISTAQLYCVEQGTKELSFRAITKLAKAYGLPLQALADALT